jgi:hypothetical protein
LRYLGQAEAVARELGEAWDLEPVLVHPMPAAADGPAEREAVASLIGTIRAGGGRDLDSYLAILEDAGGSERAVVGSVVLGTELAAGTAAADWTELARTLRLRRLPPETLQARLLEHNRTAEASSFAAYLELVARHLEGRLGRPALRLPLLLVPHELREDHDTLGADGAQSFLLTWTNLVAEERTSADGTRQRSVELFRQGLPSGDALAVKLYAELGYTCRLYPALRNSLVLGGGYRCASNPLRRGSRP